MGAIDKIRSLFISEKKEQPKINAFNNGSYKQVYSYSFNGEKNLGEIGPVKDYYLDYDMLRLRSWQSYLESEITQTIMNKYTLWMISKGLKLQCEPSEQTLKSEGVNVDIESFDKVTESRFSLWSRSANSDYTKNNNLNFIAKEAYKNCKIGGDVLVVLRYVKGIVSVQLIDGAHVCNPHHANHETIKNGIEFDSTGKHIAYHVKGKNRSWTTIPAYSTSTGLKTAFLVYGNRYRLDSMRGLPLIATSLETLKKLERYKEATVGSAEERQKIVYQIIHGNNSTGESPFVQNIARAFDPDNNDNLPVDVVGNQLANRVAATTNKQAFNMPIDAELKALESKNELYFKDFYSTNSDIICAAVGIPPNVAFSIYNDSFSASRAATKDWEHTISVNRDDFAFQFYQPIYEFWLHTEILKRKIEAQGYLEAFYSKNYMVLEAYRNARFTGAMFPHIDPVKEVTAERLKLGELGANIPLTTVERATEVLNGGDSSANLSQFADEVLRFNEAIPTPNPAA